jgi:hypothetical protein
VACGLAVLYGSARAQLERTKNCSMQTNLGEPGHARAACGNWRPCQALRAADPGAAALVERLKLPILHLIGLLDPERGPLIGRWAGLPAGVLTGSTGRVRPAAPRGKQLAEDASSRPTMPPTCSRTSTRLSARKF